MPMKESCKYFESRTYPSGDTVRKCDLDLAPEAPWRCPEGCVRYTPRLADVNWQHGTLITPPTPAEPHSLGQDQSSAALLDEAEDIVNAAGQRFALEGGIPVVGPGGKPARRPFWTRWFGRS